MLSASSLAPSEKCEIVPPIFSGRATVAQQPAGGALDELAGVEHYLGLYPSLHHVVQTFHLVPKGAQREDLTRRHVGAGDVGRLGPRLLAQPEDERGSAAVHQAVRDVGGRDLAVQPVLVDLLPETVPQGCREVPLQLAREVRVLGRVRVE